jgi:LysM repeat protein
MTGDYPNLIELTKGYLTGDFKNKLSSLLGESRDRTQMGLNAAIPGLLSGLDSAASTPDGARRLASAVDNADDGILSNVGSMFGRTPLKGIGSGPLQSILGVGALSELTGRIGKTSGLSGKAVSTLIGFLGPVVFGMLKKLKRSRGLDASGLSSLLSSQRSNIAAAMPEEMRESTEEVYGAPRPVPHARLTETYSNPETERHTSSLAWIVPLAVLAGLLGMIWYGATRSSVHAGRDETGLAEQTARERMNVSHMASLDALTSKYQSVLEVAKGQGVQISNLTGQNGKLILQGTAPSLEAANKVWDEIKRVNPKMNDIIADIKVDSSLVQPTSGSEYSEAGHNESTSPEGVLPRAKPTTRESSTESTTHTYVVKSGDTLSSISKQFYGNTRDYMRIFNENSSQLKNPNRIEDGQQLEIPMK